MMIFKETNMPVMCPPYDAIQMDIEPVFRFTEDKTITDKDFLNHLEKGLSYDPKRICEAIALSFYTNEEAAMKLTKRFKAFKKKTLTSGKITYNCGKHKTENQHLNLWAFKDADMLKVYLGKED